MLTRWWNGPASNCLIRPRLTIISSEYLVDGTHKVSHGEILNLLIPECWHEICCSDKHVPGDKSLELRELMIPFRHFRSSNCIFFWNEELDYAFRHSQKEIIAAIQDGLEIFNPMKRTSLRTDRSKRGMGYFQLQKFYDWPDETPDCSENGRRRILAGSHFLQTAEEWYAPIEGKPCPRKGVWNRQDTLRWDAVTS